MARPRETGTVKWFSNSKGYGFIALPDGRDAFVHHNEIKMEGFRFLKGGQTVSFDLVDEGSGPRALSVLIEPEPVVKRHATEPIESSQASDRVYKRGAVLNLEEDREHEFKSLQKSKDPVKTILDYYVEEYVNAFLNTNGGVIYFGIDDDGRAQGIELTRSTRDDLRIGISKIINKFQPPVEPELYQIKFVAVADSANRFVVELRVCQGVATLYMTGSQNFYLRRDGSNFLMPFAMIRERLQVQQAGTDLKQPEPKFTQSADVLAAGAADLDLGILLAMVFMSWSDHKLTEDEINLIERRARDEGLDEQEVNLLMRATVHPPLVETIANYLPTMESKKAAATIAYLSAISDNKVTARECEAFGRICDALGLQDKDRKDIQALASKSLQSEC